MWHYETRWRRLEPEVGSTTAPLSDLFAVPRPSLAADENRHPAHRQHLGCLAPQQQFGQPAAAVRRHEDQVAAVALRHAGITRLPSDWPFTTSAKAVMRTRVPGSSLITGVLMMVSWTCPPCAEVATAAPPVR